MKNIIAILFLFFSLTWSLVGQQVISLQEAIEYGLQNHNALKLSRIETADAGSQVNEFKAIGMPQLHAYIDYQRSIQLPTSLVPAEFFGGPEGEFAKINFGTDNLLSGMLDFSVLLFDGNYLQGLKAAKLFKTLVAKQESLTRKEISENITRAYLSVLIAEENLGIINKNIGNVDKTLADTKAFYESGFVEQLDVDRLQLSLDNLTTEKENLSKLIEISYNVLKYQMGFPIHEPIKVAEDLELMVDLLQVDAWDANRNLDYNNRPEYDLINTNIELNTIDLKRLKQGYLPSVKAFANYQQSLQRNKLINSPEPGFLPASAVGLSINVPIFDGNEKKSSIQRVRLRLEKNAIEKEEFERGMHLQVENAKIQLINAQNTLALRKKSLELNEDIYNKTLIKFREGVGSSVEVSQAESSLYQSQGNYISSLYDLVLAKTELDIATGDLK